MAQQLAQLPESARRRLDELKASLIGVLGDELEALLVYGSAARGGYRQGQSDVDVLAVLRSDPRALLEAIGPALQLARFSARIEVMLVTSAEVPHAADVFPLLYADIARASVCIHGKSPFEGLTIDPHHLRVRIEQELREARIRLRRVATDLARGPIFAGAVERKIKQVRAPLHAWLELRFGPSDDHLPAVLDAAGKAYGVDVAPLHRSCEDAEAAFESLVRLLDAVLREVNAHHTTEEI
ncbi:nucleotidyltransferase domain-containing protein [Pendulispora albinea]|uniref:Nucleotidyltransferase domain-containing protein n=1 Tax=Pendulispora albinea TaxID=2741071 RepID=A0ABZ2M308_9BACT